MHLITQAKRAIITKLKERYFSYPYQEYNESTKSIFIHIPKSAGSSILNILGAPPMGRLHIDYSHYLRSDAKRYEEYFKFAIVRNPVDRLYSCYNYIIQGGNGEKEDVRMTEFLKSRSDSFDEFVGDVLNHQMVLGWALFRPQFFFVCNAHAECQMDMILKIENIDEDYAKLKERISGIPDKLPTLNISGKGNPPELSRRSLARIHELYEKDFEIFYPH
ncbi:sulfotransferase family protein [Puniceicoccaceae bacterium K14]|nr:sulfotransferase family protein [Puniceicoccaceae bacterium K14]